MKDIKLYALSTCIHCKDTKKYLDKCGIDYDCVFVDELDKESREQLINEIRPQNPACAFPMLLVGSKVIIGFKEDAIKEALDQE